MLAGKEVVVWLWGGRHEWQAMEVGARLWGCCFVFGLSVDQCVVSMVVETAFQPYIGLPMVFGVSVFVMWFLLFLG